MAGEQQQQQATDATITTTNNTQQDDASQSDQNTTPSGQQPAPEGQDAGQQQASDDNQQGNAEQKSEADKKASKKSKRTGRYISKLQERNAQFAQENDELRAELERQKQNRQSAQIQDDPNDPRPRRDDYDDFDDYDTAKDSWLIRQTRRQIQTEQQDQQGEKRMSHQDLTRADNIEMIFATGNDRYHDFETVVRNPESRVSMDMIDLMSMQEQETTADMAYYFGNHPDEVNRLRSLPKQALAIQVGRLAADIEAGRVNPKTVTRKPSNAPPPATPPSGGTTQKARSIYDPDLTTDEYIDMRRQGLTT